MRIAVDAMGGDHAPGEIVAGCLQAAASGRVDIILVGDRSRIEAALDGADASGTESFTIVHTDQVIDNEDSPVAAVRSKPEASMVKAVELVRQGAADAALSAGNTGALLAAGLLRMGRMKGVERPGIVSVYPLIGQEKPFSLLVDAGANVECKPANLLNFAYMGSIYMEAAFGVARPTVGLINVGTEESKGTAALRETYNLLAHSGLNFIGNLEGRDIPLGKADVLVCDGFTGNVVLKLTEGLAWTILKTIRSRFTEGTVAKMGAALLAGKIRGLREEFDYASYGSAPILGLRGLLFKMHGSSSAQAVKTSVLKAADVAAGQALAAMEEAMGQL